MKAEVKTWTSQETELARELYQQRAPNEVFVELLGRTKTCAASRLNRVNAPSAVGHFVSSESKVNVPDHVWEDRNRRLMAPKSLTARLCGDPEPGRSALERRA